MDLDRREASDPAFPGIPLDVPERHQASRILIANWPLLIARGVWMSSFVFDSREDALERAGRSAPVMAFQAWEYERASASASELVAFAVERGRLAFAALGLSVVDSLPGDPREPRRLA